MHRGIILSALAVLASLSGASAAQAAFSAHGSVEQVYVTGLDPGAQTTLLDGAGKTVATRKAGSLGGALFRNVKPGGGYRVQSGATTSDALTVLTTASAPPSTGVYDQTIAPKGYQYLTTRD